MPEQGCEPTAVVISGFGDEDTGGGLFVLEGEEVRRVDWLATTGIAVEPGGRRFARLLREAGRSDSAGELLVYDRRGVEAYRRIDDLTDAHGVVWHDGMLVVASTVTNTVLWLSPAGDILRTWKAPGAGDAWHLNSLVVDGERLLVCAFGRFERHRGWAEHGAADRQGFVFDVETGETVTDGLTCPHDPLRLGGAWAVCNSRGHEVVFIDDGRVVERVALDGWTRGLAADDDHLYVGLSAHRGEGASGTGAVVVVDRATCRILRRVDLPCREVYSVTLVPEALLGGIERGFRTNEARTGEERQADLFRAAGIEPERLWSGGEPLDEEDCRVQVAIDLPSTLVRGERVVLDWTVTNAGGAVLSSSGEHPVRLSYRWFDLTGERLLEEGPRAALPHDVPPGGRASGLLRLVASDRAGRALLRVSLVQELVRWFDDAHPSSGVTRVVDVKAEDRVTECPPGPHRPSSSSPESNSTTSRAA